MHAGGRSCPVVPSEMCRSLIMASMGTSLSAWQASMPACDSLADVNVCPTSFWRGRRQTCLRCRPHYRQAVMQHVRNVGEKAAAPFARGGAKGVDLSARKICACFDLFELRAYRAVTCAQNFDIDANFAADIIPRG